MLRSVGVSKKPFVTCLFTNSESHGNYALSREFLQIPDVSGPSARRFSADLLAQKTYAEG